MLLFLPGGDRAGGLQEMLQARDRGELVRGEADYQLHWIYLWYEHQPERARELLRDLDRQYPSNPLFLQRIAEMERDYFHDHQASAAAWEALLDRARAHRVEVPEMTETRARIGLGAELIELSQFDRAIAELSTVIAGTPQRPYAAQALAQLEIGEAYARSSRRDRAIDALNAAIALAPRDDPENIRTRARDRLRRVTNF
jgi:tetratricopeptide (TPR) repeat protein